MSNFLLIISLYLSIPLITVAKSAINPSKLFAGPAMTWLAATPSTTTTRSQGNRHGKPSKAMPLKPSHHLILQKTAKSQSTASHNSAVVWIDLENVRGKSGFDLDRMSHEQALFDIGIWTKVHKLAGKVIVVVDHGSLECGYYIDNNKSTTNDDDEETGTSSYSDSNNDFAVVFAGPYQKADDVIAHGVGMYDAAVVVTADSGLQTRCRRGQRKSLNFVDPAHFLDDLEWTQCTHYERLHEEQELQLRLDVEEKSGVENDSRETEEVKMDSEDEAKEKQEVTPELTRALEEEIRLRAQLLGAEIELDERSRRKRKTTTNKKRRKLQDKVASLRSKLAMRGPSLLDQITRIDDGSSNVRFSNGLPVTTDVTDSDDDELRQRQRLLLSQWEDILRNRQNKRREQTGDRIVFAENLRRQLENRIEGDGTGTTNVVVAVASSDEVANPQVPSHKLNPAQAFVKHINSKHNNNNVIDDKKNGATTFFNSPPSLTEIPIDSLIKTTVLREDVHPTRPDILTSTDAEQNINADVDENVNVGVATVLSTRDRILEEINNEDVAEEARLDELRIVAISDTHGFESQMTFTSVQVSESDAQKNVKGSIVNNDDDDDNDDEMSTLPDGDLLLHLGDFASDGGSTRDEINFDRWLAKQPHKYKIIVRGNHDPWQVNFPLSGAWYVTHPMTIQLGGGSFSLGVIPFGSSRRKTLSSGEVPRSCDVIATHEPPYRSNDKTLRGRHVGSGHLVQLVREMKEKDTPRLWLCGHIHEGRGITKRRFHKTKRETTIVNCSNANKGFATHLTHGPVVIDISSKKGDEGKEENDDADDDDQSPRIITMQDESINRVAEGSTDFFTTNRKVPVPNTVTKRTSTNDVDSSMTSASIDIDDDDDDDGTTTVVRNRDLLLAVDLGLKSGVAMYNSDGYLIKYEQFLFDQKNLQQTFERLIVDWENEANRWYGKNQNTNQQKDEQQQEQQQVSPPPWKIAHVAIEGATKSDTLTAWHQAILRHTSRAKSNDDDDNDEKNKNNNNNHINHINHHHSHVKANNENDIINLVRISPEEWRNELLSTKESSNGGKDAKAAARLIARQIVYDYGQFCITDDNDESADENTTSSSTSSSHHHHTHKGKFPTDVAEAVVMGLYVSRKLGWIIREPAIRRYTNGNVIFPPKQ